MTPIVPREASNGLGRRYEMLIFFSAFFKTENEYIFRYHLVSRYMRILIPGFLESMPPKAAAKGAKGGKGDPKGTAKAPKKKEGGGGGKAKKKKWSKGKVRDKLNNMVLFDKPTYEKLYKEVSSLFFFYFFWSSA